MFIKLLMMAIIMGLMFVAGDHPLWMVMVLFFIVIFYSFNLYMYLGSWWIGMVLLMVVLSGILVVFTYMASMTPNESFSYFGYVVGGVVVVISSYLLSEWEMDQSSFSLKLWMEEVMMVMLMIISFLLVIMLMVVWLSEWWSGAVRV